MKSKKVEVEEKTVSAFMNRIRNNFPPTEKTQWYEFVDRLLNENRTPTLDAFLEEEIH